MTAKASDLGRFALTALLGVVGAAGCPQADCPDEAAGCPLPTPCEPVAFDCDTTIVPSVHEIEPGELLPQGEAALGAVGDLLLVNDRVAVVIDALHHENHLAESGGMVLDIATWPFGDDSINHIWHGAGLLPDDAAVYTQLSTFDAGGVVGVQVRGHLKGDERHRIVTRYELRRCEPGLRVRSELTNGGDEDVVWALQDGFFWGEKSLLPFTPGAGFVHPSFGLGNINEVFRATDYIAGSGASADQATVFAVGCDVAQLEGFHDDYVSAAGTARRVVTPGDGIVYERFIGAAAGPGVGRANDIARTLREQLHGDTHVTVSGQVVTPTEAPLTGQHRASVLLRDTSGVLAEVVPALDGSFAAKVPRGQSIIAELYAFSRRASSLRVLPPVMADAAFEPFFINDAATLRVRVRNGSGQGGRPATLFFEPRDDRTKSRTTAQYLQQGRTCAPMLGYPYGGSPACNRAVVRSEEDFELPAGRYRVYAFRGPFAQAGKADVDLAPGESLSVVIEAHDLPAFFPGGEVAGLLGADFHVHGSGSYDSSIPDRTRVLSFVAAGIDVIAATDHDAISDYQRATDELGLAGVVRILGGLEATPLVLQNLRPDVTYPQVIGHWNFWPLPVRPDRPRRGAPNDEFAEPGELFDRVRRAGLGPDGIIQLNHPTSGDTFGRANGWASALSIRLDEPLPILFDGAGPGMFLRTPPGASFSNADFHTIEVLNGTSGRENFSHRAFWFYLLNQGILRAQTSSSDSHALSDSVLGTPRTLVEASFIVPSDLSAFQDAVKKGHSQGTNGPVVRTALERADGSRLGSDIERLIAPAPGDQLAIHVHGAPWVPIDEVRVLLNGQVVFVDRLPDNDPAALFGDGPVHRASLRLPLSTLVPDLSSDAWLLVEAGAPLPSLGDLNCDSYPDTTDNDGDGAVTWMDVDRDGDGAITSADQDRTGDGAVDDADVPAPCSGGTGPIDFAPLVEGDRYEVFRAVVPGGMPLSMGNPYLLDLDDNGRFDPPGL